MGKPKYTKKQVRQTTSNENKQTNQSENKAHDPDTLPPICRPNKRLNCNVVRPEPDLVASVQCDSDWKNPYKCVACGERFGWRLDRDSHELVCLDQISGQALQLQMETKSNNLQREKQIPVVKNDRVFNVKTEDTDEEECYGGFVNIVDADANFQDLGAEVEIATLNKSDRSDMNQNLKNKTFKKQPSYPRKSSESLIKVEPITPEKLNMVRDSRPAVPTATSHSRIYLSEFQDFTRPSLSSTPSQSMEELLDFRLDQADPFEIDGLLSSLKELQLQNSQMEKSVESLKKRKQQLLATQRRLLALDSSSIDVSALDYQANATVSQLSSQLPSSTNISKGMSSPFKLNHTTPSLSPFSTPSPQMTLHDSPSLLLRDTGRKDANMMEQITPSPRKCKKSPKGHKIPVIVTDIPRHVKSPKCPFSTMRKQF